MVTIWIRICFLCHSDGEHRPAEFYYYTPEDDETYDVCQKCSENVKKAGLEPHPLEMEDLIMMK